MPNENHIEILLALPQDVRPVYDEGLGDSVPRRGFRYSTTADYDEVLSVRKSNYDSDAALRKLVELSSKRGASPVTFFKTRRHYCLRIKLSATSK